jgi:hypothetical protein
MDGMPFRSNRDICDAAASNVVALDLVEHL